MLEVASQAALEQEIARQIGEDQILLNQLRCDVRSLISQTRRISPRATTSISLVAADGGNNQLRFDPFLIQLVRVVDSSNKVVNQCLEDHGLLMGKGTVVEATIINAPSWKKKKKRERDREMHQTRKGNQWFFGMKAHIGVDKDSGLIHSVVSRAGNVHDPSASELLHGQEEVVDGDGGYQGLERRREKGSKTVECRIAMGRGQRRRLSDSPEDQLQQWYERAKAHVRSKVEHGFGIMKQQFGFEKSGLCGIGKNQSKVVILAGVSNLFMVRNQVLWMKEA